MTTRALGIWVAVAAGCAPATATMTMPNPARSPSSIEATQTYEVPPFREDHRYEATLARWTPTGIEFRVHLVNVGSCALPSSYSFTLVDDRGARYAFQPLGAPTEKTASGHLGATVNDVTVDGTFGTPIGGGTRYVVLEVRPREDRACTALDFRWDFQG